MVNGGNGEGSGESGAKELVRVSQPRDRYWGYVGRFYQYVYIYINKYRGTWLCNYQFLNVRGMYMEMERDI